LTGKLLVICGTFTVTNAEEGKIDFEKQIYPILENSCVSCHKAPYVKKGRTRPTKPKADLRFDAAFGIVQGGDNGAVVVPKDAAKSSLLQRTILDEDHDDFMPPKGDVLTDAQKELVKRWIEEGADFGGWKGNEDGKPEDAKVAFEYGVTTTSMP